MKVFTPDGLQKVENEIEQLDDVVALLKVVAKLLVSINMEQQVHTLILNSSLLEGKSEISANDLIGGDSSTLEGALINDI